MKYTHVCAVNFHQVKIDSDFPCLSDEIAEPRPELPPLQTAKSSIIIFDCIDSWSLSFFFSLFGNT